MGCPVLMQPVSCPSTAGSSSSGLLLCLWLVPQSKLSPSCKCLFLFPPFLLRFFMFFLRFFSFFMCFHVNVWIFLTWHLHLLQILVPWQRHMDQHHSVQCLSQTPSLTTCVVKGRVTKMRKALDPPCGMQPRGPFGRQEYSLKHSVVQPITIIIVPLLTRVHKLCKPVCQLLFLWCKSHVLAGQMGALKFLTGYFIFICLLSDLFQPQNYALQLPCLQNMGHTGEAANISGSA